jgi:23S rRNA pseudouridine1911/1915/1917 synthase
MIDIIPLFEDNHLLILNKPSGLLTQPSGTQQDNLEEKAKAWIKKKYNKPGNVFLHAIHRLDKSVSGIVVFAKTQKALARLQGMMRDKKFSKTYWAWVEGILPKEKGILEHYIWHDEFQAKIVPSYHPQGKHARLTYHVLQKTVTCTLVEIVLETGRYHQIRVQFGDLKCPVCGDVKYGSREKYDPEGKAIALHHRKMQLHHPISQEILCIEAIPSLLFAARIKE